MKILSLFTQMENFKAAIENDEISKNANAVIFHTKTIHKLITANLVQNEIY